MITMSALYRSHPKKTIVVIMIASVWTAHCIFYYLDGSSYRILKHVNISESLPMVVSNKNETKLQNTFPKPKGKIKNPQRTSRETFPSLKDTRIKVRKEIKDFLHYIHKNEEQLIPELGGVPIRCMLSTSWRSGSTFTGQALSLHPAAFLHYEPLWKHVGFHKIRSPWKNKFSLRVLENQLHCNYTVLKRRGVNLSSPSRARWFGKAIKKHSLKDISSYCSLYPVQIIKILRLGSQLLETLLEDLSLNLRVILMVRDPRALINSRKRAPFGGGELRNATFICQDYYDDYKVLKELEHVFPGRIMKIRFEDIASNPEKVIPKLYNFCGLDTSESLQEFIAAHTKPDNKGYMGKSTFSTFRNTSKVSVEWTEKLRWTEIDKIQTRCTKAMKAWGYNKVDKGNMNVETFTARIR